MHKAKQVIVKVYVMGCRGSHLFYYGKYGLNHPQKNLVHYPGVFVLGNPASDLKAGDNCTPS